MPFIFERPMKRFARAVLAYETLSHRRARFIDSGFQKPTEIERERIATQEPDVSMRR